MFTESLRHSIQSQQYVGGEERCEYPTCHKNKKSERKAARSLKSDDQFSCGHFEYQAPRWNVKIFQTRARPIYRRADIGLW